MVEVSQGKLIVFILSQQFLRVNTLCLNSNQKAIDFSIFAVIICLTLNKKARQWQTENVLIKSSGW
jgi:hypothetical protein